MDSHISYVNTYNDLLQWRTLQGKGMFVVYQHEHITGCMFAHTQ